MRQKASEGQDYISNLPDHIIGHILSFLSTRDAVRTSTLSKTWIHKWTFVTRLVLWDGEKSYSYNYRIKQFPKFVSRVLSHIKSASIQDLRLHVGMSSYAYNINEWLSAVLNKGVKKIHLIGSISTLSYYPLFQSPSLETLVLQMNVPCIIKVPTFVYHPSLTVLSLEEIKFTHCSQVKLEELTLKLPLLRSYRAINCTWSGVKSVTLEAPLLEEVKIEKIIRPFTKRQSNSPTKTKFSSSRLTKFFFRGYLSSLSETILVDGHIASVYIFLKDTSVEETHVSLCKLLSLFTNTECLMLNFYRLQGLAGVGRHLTGNPTFAMLCQVQLKFVTCEVLMSLLLKSPCLKTLVLQMKGSGAETQYFAIVPDCFLSTLKVVKIECFFGSEGELSFAKFVMENARVLERLSFWFHWKLPSSKVEKAKEKLFLFRKSFSTVIMEFHTYGN